MSTFNEQDHPRHNDGRFAGKPEQSAGINLPGNTPRTLDEAHEAFTGEGYDADDVDTALSMFVSAGGNTEDDGNVYLDDGDMHVVRSQLRSWNVETDDILSEETADSDAYHYWNDDDDCYVVERPDGHVLRIGHEYDENGTIESYTWTEERPETEDDKKNPYFTDDERFYTDGSRNATYTRMAIRAFVRDSGKRVRGGGGGGLA